MLIIFINPKNLTEMNSMKLNTLLESLKILTIWTPKKTSLNWLSKLESFSSLLAFGLNCIIVHALLKHLYILRFVC